MSQIVCTEHDVNVDVKDYEVHGSTIVFLGDCTEDGGHEIQVTE
jgi:hypothetical protein